MDIENLPKINFNVIKNKMRCWMHLGRLLERYWVDCGHKLGGMNWEGAMNKVFTRVEEIPSSRPPLVLACRSFNAKILSVFGYASVPSAGKYSPAKSVPRRQKNPQAANNLGGNCSRRKTMSAANFLWKARTDMSCIFWATTP